MGLKAGLHLLQQTGKAVANYADDAARLVAKNGDDVARAISSTSDDVARYAKACGKRSILETKPSIFHGTNPTISYPPSGKVYELPRFCTQEMQQARKLNQIATRQIKQPISSSFPKATAEDLKRLTSETVEDSFSRVQWTNPKDGKVYNLLKQSETADGKCLIRILDQKGAFVKEATLTPKNILMIDAQTGVTPFRVDDFTHGAAVYKYLRRNNPFAQIDVIDVTAINRKYYMDICLGETRGIDCHKLAQSFKDITSRIKKGEKIDYITVSIGCEFNAKGGLNIGDLDKRALKALEELSSTAKGKTRILFAAGNDGKSALNSYLTADCVEGVGALDHAGKLTGFSASRNSRYTQHYEQGIFQIKETEYGLNITGLPGTDLPRVNKMSRKDLEIALEEINGKIEYLDKKILRARKLSRQLWDSDRIRNDSFYCRDDKIEKILNALKKEQKELCIDKSNICKNLDTISCYADRRISGTSFSTPIRTAKLALNDMMEGVL